MSGSLPSAVVAMATTDAPASTTTDLPPNPAKDMVSSTTKPARVDLSAREFLPGCGLAIFSTELCTQAKRELEGQYRPPVIVRSDGVRGVVDAARNWQSRFKVQCLCIFPGQGWTVGDLWDAVDVQLDTPSFCQEMLTFISRATYHAARRFAMDWIRAYPDRLSVVASDMAELHTTNDPFSMVDKIYNEGERSAFPRTFLWHVAHMMRASVLDTKLATAAAASHDKNPAPIQQRQRAKTMVQVVTTGQISPPEVAEASASAPPSAIPTAPEMVKSTSIPIAAPSSELQQELESTASQELRQPANQHAGNTMNGAARHTMTSPNIPPQALKVHKGPPRSMGNTGYPPPGPSHNWIENNHRPAFGQYPPRQTSGGMPQLVSPQLQYLVPNMAIGQHVVPTGYIAPYTHGSPMITANMASLQQYGPAIGQAGLMMHPSVMAANPHMGPVYAAQPPPVRGASIGDMTNTSYYANGIVPQVVHQQGPQIRRPSNCNTNGGMLYDPYNGTNSDFREPNNYNKGKKPHYNDSSYQANRSRNVSNSGSRSAYKPERMNNQPYHVAPNGYRPRTRENSADDPSITENRSTGCHEQWIGPENLTVTELFVGDLPMDTFPAEVSKMFEQQMNIKPINVSIRVPKKYDGFTQPDRCHAFVALESAADAKKAMGMRDRIFRLRDDGHPVSVSVPRRFFQYPIDSLRRGSLGSGSYNVPTQSNERDIHKGAREQSNGVGPADEGAPRVKAVYSPQDARSGLRKKSDAKSKTNDGEADESPQVRKPKSRQTSPSKKQHTKREGAAPKAPLGKETKSTVTSAKAPAATAPVAGYDKSAQDESGDRKDSVLPDALGTIIVQEPAVLPSSASPVRGTSLGTTGSPKPQLKPGKESSGPIQGDSRASVEPTSFPVPSVWSNPTANTDTAGQSTKSKSTKSDEPTQVTSDSTLQRPARTVENGDVVQEVSRESASRQHTLTVSDQKTFKESKVAQEEKTTVNDTPNTTLAAEPAQPAAAKETPEATINTESDKVAAIAIPDPGVDTASGLKPATVLPADVAAKPGVAQVTSLHPYSKANKMQQKKAKEALRKQQRQKEQAEKAEKAEKAKAEKEKTDKAKAEKMKLSMKEKAATLEEDGTAKSDSPRDMPVLPDQTKEPKSETPASPDVKKADMRKVREREPTAKAEDVAVASDGAQKVDHTSDAAVPLIISADRFPTKARMPILTEAEYIQLQDNDAATMATGTTKEQPKVEKSQDSSITSMPAAESTKPEAPEPATPTPKKKSKSKRKKTKKAATGKEGDKLAEVDTNGKPLLLTRRSNSITLQAINAPLTTTQQVSFSVFAAGLATEVRRSSITTLPSISPEGPILYPSSAQARERTVKGLPFLASPQHLIPHSEQLGHSKIAHHLAYGSDTRSSSPCESEKTAINSPSTLGASGSDREVFIPHSLLADLPTKHELAGSEILQSDIDEDVPSVETPQKKAKKTKKKNNKKKSTAEADDSPAPTPTDKLDFHVTAAQPSPSSQKAGAPLFSFQGSAPTTDSASSSQDPLLAAAEAATKPFRNEEVSRPTGGKIHYFVTTDKNASVADVQAQYAAAGKKPLSEAYQLGEGETIDDLVPKKLRSENLQEYLRDNPIPLIKTEKKKDKKRKK